MSVSSEIANSGRQPPIRSGREDTAHKYQASDLVLDFSLETYIISGEEYFRSAMACSSLMREKSAARIFAGWLAKHEGVRCCHQAGVRRVYEEYHSERVTRCFLRSVSIMPNVVVAGSYPAAKYLAKEGLDTWAPNDVDIFVACRRDVDIVSRLYTECMYRHFRLIVYCAGWQGNGFPYPDDEPDLSSDYADSDGESQTGTESSEADPNVDVLRSAIHVARQILDIDVRSTGGAGSDAESPTSAVTTEEDMLVHGQPSHGNAANQNMETDLLEHQGSSLQAGVDGPSLHVLRRISAWVESLHEQTVAERKTPVFVRALAVCRETVLQLPRRLSPPAFKPVETRRLKPVGYSRAGRPLIPINIIQYGVPEDLGVPYDWPAAVCSTFDITLCAVSLTVQPDLSFEFREHEGAFSDLCLKKLRLSQTAFSKQGSEVHAQMKRVFKYALRGCRW